MVEKSIVREKQRAAGRARERQRPPSKPASVSVAQDEERKTKEKGGEKQHFLWLLRRASFAKERKKEIDKIARGWGWEEREREREKGKDAG